jgi:hypothetical protein
VNTVITGLNIDKAIRIFEATRKLAFADIPAVDLKDRLSVLTVAAGLRQVGVLETWGQRLAQTRELIISHGLFTSVATCVWSSIERPAATPHREVLRELDEKRVAGKPKHVLWLYADAADRNQYRRPNYTQQEAGRLLHYPPCCIEFESSFMARWPQAQLEALLAETGGDDAKLLGLVRRAKQLPPPKIALPDNAFRTEQHLPFVLHVACDECLNDPGSPSVTLNARYEALVKEVDTRLHDLFLQVQAIYQDIAKDQAAKRDLLLQIHQLHEAFFVSTSPKR